MKRTERKNKQREHPTAIYTFESPEEIKEFAVKGPVDGDSRKHHGDDFCKYSWNESLECLDKGWDGVIGLNEKVEALALGLKDSMGLDYRWDVVGQMVDVGTFVTGNPECWLEQEPIETPKETIKIVVDGRANCMIGGDNIETRGAVVAALIEALYDKYFIDLTFILTTSNVCGEKDIEMRCHLNTKNGYSKNMVAFYSAHPALLRRFFFVVCEVELNRSDCGGYGGSVGLKKGDADIFFPELTQEEEHKYSTIESAQETLEEILKGVVRAEIA